MYLPKSLSMIRFLAQETYWFSINIINKLRWVHFYILSGTIKLLISQHCVIFYSEKIFEVVKSVKYLQVVIL